jgi:hypothetical protein
MRLKCFWVEQFFRLAGSNPNFRAYLLIIRGSLSEENQVDIFRFGLDETFIEHRDNLGNQVIRLRIQVEQVNHAVFPALDYYIVSLFRSSPCCPLT